MTQEGPACRVAFPALSELSYTFSTVEAAITSARSNPRQPRAKGDSTLVDDALVEEVAWADREVRFGLPNGRTLRVYLRDVFTEWEVARTDLLPALSGPLHDLARGPVRQDCVGKQGTSTWQWDGGKVLRARVGQRMKMLFAGHVWLYVYTYGQLILHFYAKERLDDGSLFLCWYEDD